MKPIFLKKALLAFMILPLLFLSGCDLFTTGNTSTDASDNIINVYGIDESVLESLATTNDYPSTVTAAAIVMPSTVEITAEISFSYTASYYSPWGSRTETVTDSAISEATAFFINEDGYLLTNAHVVTLSDYEDYPGFTYTGWNITLNYADSDTMFSASIVDYDETLDLAILQIDEPIADLAYVTFFNITSPDDSAYGTSEAISLYYGEPIIAVGNAEGYGISVTSGVVSAPLRYFDDSGTVIQAIQTDAAINSGNSGGPLSNMWGATIGIDSFKIVTSTSENLGYAIPSYVVMDYIDSVSDSIQYYYTNARSFDKTDVISHLG